MTKVPIDYIVNGTEQAVSEIKSVNGAIDKSSGSAKSAGLSLTDLKSGLDLAKEAYSKIKGAIDSVINPTVALAKDVRDLARDIGATPQEASKLIQAADDMNVSVGTLETGLRAAIKRGVDPTIEGMSKLSDQYLSIQDPIERTKFLMDTFGRSGAELGPLMEKGSEGIRELGDAAEAAGLVMDEQAVQAARNYEIATDNFSDAVLGAKLALADVFLPALNEGITVGANWVTTVAGMTKAVGDGTISMWDFAKASMEVVWTDKTLTDVTDELTAATWEQDRAGEANAARWQGLADSYVTSIIPETGNMTAAIYEMVQAGNENAAAISAQAVSEGELKAAGDLLILAMREYNTQLLFQIASQDLDADAALNLAFHLGLVDDKIWNAVASMEELTKKFDLNKDGVIDAKEATLEYYRAVTDLDGAIRGMEDRTIRINVITTNYLNDVYGPGGPGYEPAPAPATTGGGGGSSGTTNNINVTVNTNNVDSDVPGFVRALAGAYP